jgi:hypothetical protein
VCSKHLATLFLAQQLFATENIVDLQLFNNLVEVGGSFEVTTCVGFKSIFGVEKLKTVGGNVRFIHLVDAAFTSFDGLHALTSVGGGITMDSLSQLTRMHAFSQLVRVGVELHPSTSGRSIHLNDMHLCSDVQQIFDSLVHVDGIIEISQLQMLGLHSNTKEDHPTDVGITPEHFFPLLVSAEQIRLQHVGSTNTPMLKSNSNLSSRVTRPWFPALKTLTSSSRAIGSKSGLYMSSVSFDWSQGAFPLLEAGSIQISHFSFIPNVAGATVFGSLSKCTITWYYLRAFNRRNQQVDLYLDGWFPSLIDNRGHTLLFRHEGSAGIFRGIGTGFKNLETIDSITIVDLPKFSSFGMPKLKRYFRVYFLQLSLMFAHTFSTHGAFVRACGSVVVC